ncbi:hypothetical protein AAG747_28975 [Rapidithrix thailandica]|uniref:Uncharacterized protein n=1 Tax=Rapidithrix thailandica TaxID=413964 RepID=A0AAW9SHL5_9BACT
MYFSEDEESPSDPLDDIGDKIEVPGEIDSVYVDEDGKVVIVDTEGNTTVKERPQDPETGAPAPVAVSDEQGNTYVVDKNGEVKKVGEEGKDRGLPSTERNNGPNDQHLSSFGRLVKSVLLELRDDLTEKRTTVTKEKKDYLVEVQTRWLDQLKPSSGGSASGNVTFRTAFVVVSPSPSTLKEQYKENALPKEHMERIKKIEGVNLELKNLYVQLEELNEWLGEELFYALVEELQANEKLSAESKPEELKEILESKLNQLLNNE